MTITLIFLALLMGAVLWWLFRQSWNTQPWVAHAGAQDVHAGALAHPPPKTALAVFLAVATSLFALFVSAYAMRMHFGDWVHVHEPRILWWNTALLVVTSGAMHWAVTAARRGDAGTLRTALIASGVLTLAFLAGQLVAWRELDAAGLYASSNPANGFFYLLTAVHAVHVVGGLVAWGRVLARVRRAIPAAGRLVLSVELCALYWHFLLAVWIVLFAVLLFT